MPSERNAFKIRRLKRKKAEVLTFDLAEQRRDVLIIKWQLQIDKLRPAAYCFTDILT